VFDFLSGELLARFLGVLAIDLILSGDNAVVIALAVRGLHGPTRRRAIILGAAGAVLLRLIFAAIVTILIQIPLLQAVGGFLLLWVAWKLIVDEPGHDEESGVQAGGNLWEAVRIIIVADVVMSLDNVVALVAVSGGNLALLVFGLALTIPLIVFGSTILSAIMDRLPWLAYAGAGLLAFVAVELFFADRLVHDFVGDGIASLERPIALAFAAAFVAVAWLYTRRSARAKGA
jgi:YjbE family integral membrane protein